MYVAKCWIWYTTKQRNMLWPIAKKAYQSGICGGLQRRLLYHHEPLSCGLSNSNQFSKRGYGGGGIVLWGFLKNVHTISEAKSLQIKNSLSNLFSISCRSTCFLSRQGHWKICKGKGKLIFEFIFYSHQKPFMECDGIGPYMKEAVCTKRQLYNEYRFIGNTQKLSEGLTQYTTQLLKTAVKLKQCILGKCQRHLCSWFRSFQFPFIDKKMQFKKALRVWENIIQ